MSLTTNWGYTITGADTLADMLTQADFDIMTANKFAGDVRIPASLSAASMGVRNHCGWHVSPPLACEFSERLLYGNGRIKRVNNDFLVQLPAAFVTAVSAVMIDGEAWTDYAFEQNGIVRLFDVSPVSRKTEITVSYTAGIPDALMGSIKEIISGRATRALVAPNGVSSESAGGVSISYSASWSNGGGAGALQSTDLETLEPYKVKGVF